MADSLAGKNCKVTIGGNNVLGMGTWSIGGGAVAELDDTEFGDEHADMFLGLFTGGTVSFSGLHKIDDVSGQDMLRSAFFLRSAITWLQFYVNSVSYYIPNTSTATAAGGGLPLGSPYSCIYITSEPQISADRSGLTQISFTGKLVGVMRFSAAFA
jgi:hypothetical protein